MAKPHQDPSPLVEPHTIPMEIVTDILSRVPPKPLLRFKCVNKEWLSLISSTQFIKLHLHQTLHTNSHLLLILSADFSLFSVDIDNPGPRTELEGIPRCPILESPKIVGTCNGLLCIKDRISIYLYNPCTRYCFKTSDPLDTEVYYANSFGFGYDSVSDDYKIMAMKYLSPDLYVGEIKFDTRFFSMKRNDWKVGPKFCHVLASKDNKNARFTNNALHWLVETEDYPGRSILTLDLHDETYNELPLPDLGKKVRNELGLWDLGGELCLQVEYPVLEKFNIDVWVMKEYGVKESWTKLFRFPYEDILGCGVAMKVLAYSKGCRKILLEQDSNYFWHEIGGKLENASLGLRMCSVVDVCVGSLISLAEFQQANHGCDARNKGVSGR